MNAPNELPRLDSQSGVRIPVFDAAIDETTFSYVVRAMRQTGIANRRVVTKALFGREYTSVDSPFHSGLDCFNEHLGRQPHQLPETIAAHSHAPLFASFMPKEISGPALELMASGKGSGLALAFRVRNKGVFRENPAICLDCVRQNKRDHRFAWHHRCHQLEPVVVCPRHLTPLVTGCSACNSPFSPWELPSDVCPRCHCALRTPPVLWSSAILEQLGRLANFVGSAYCGEFLDIDADLRVTTIQSRAKTVVPVRFGGVGNNLPRLIVNRFGKEFLESIGLSPVCEPFIAWPTILVYGDGLVYDPIANLLLMSALFESPMDFLEEAHRVRSEGVPLVKVSPVPFAPRFRLDAETVRQLYRRYTKPLAKERGIAEIQLAHWTATVPGFRDRVATFKQCSKLRQAKKRLIAAITDIGQELPLQPLAELKKELLLLLKSDPRWLNDILPAHVRTNLRIPSERSLNPESPVNDQAALVRVQRALASSANTLGRPISMTQENLLQKAGFSPSGPLETAEYPATLALIDHSCESAEEFRRRCLRWARNDLVKTFGRCDDVTELMVHAGVELSLVRPLKHYAEALLADPLAE